MSDLEVASCVICDDVRMEVNGKQILVGVYPGDMVIAKNEQDQEATLTFAVWLEILVKRTGDHKIGFRIDIGGAQAFALDNMDLSLDLKYNLILPFGPITLPVRDSAELSVLVKLNQEKWKIIKRKQVVITQAPKIATPSIDLKFVPGAS